MGEHLPCTQRVRGSTPLISTRGTKEACRNGLIAQTPITNPTFGNVLLAVRLLTSGVTGSHGVTGGVYKARERIHRGMLIRDY